jgi:hypothetical protein
MSYGQIVNQFKEQLSDNDKIKTLIAFLKTSFPKSKITSEEKELIEYIVKTTFKENKYAKRISKIIHHTWYQYKTLGELKEEKIQLLLDLLAKHKCCIDFNHKAPKNRTTASIILDFFIYFEKNKKRTQNKKVAHLKKILKWFSNYHNLMDLKYGNNTSVVNLFFFNSLEYCLPFIFHLFKDAKKYNIDLNETYNYFFRELFFLDSEIKGVRKLKENIILNLTQLDIDKVFCFSLKNKDRYNILDLICYYSDEKLINFALEKRSDLFLNSKINPIMILENSKLSLSTKLFLMNKLVNKMTMVRVVSLFLSLSFYDSSDKTLSEKKYINQILKKYNIIHETKLNNNIYQSIFVNSDLKLIEAYLLKYPTTMKANFYGYYPIHTFIAELNNEANKEKVIEKLNFFIKKGADLNVKNKKGNTALMMAFLLNRPQYSIKLLLENNANLHVKNNYNKSAYDYFLKYKKRYNLRDEHEFVMYMEKKYLEQLTQSNYQDEQIKKRVKL